MKKAILGLTGLSLVVALLWWANPQELLSYIAGVSPVALMGLCLLQVLTIFLITWQWKLLTMKLGFRISFYKMLHIILAGSFTEAITPAVKAGGEAVKVIMLRDTGIPSSSALAITISQKLISSIAFLSMALISLVWFSVRFQLDSSYRWTLACTLGIITLITVLATIVCFYPGLVSKIPWLNTKLHKGIANFRAQISILLKSESSLLGHGLLALAIWFLFALKAWLAALALGLNPGFSVMAAVTYLSYLAGMAPLPGGLGAFEGAVVLLLAPLSIPVSAAMALAMVLRLITFWFVFLLSAIWLGVYQTRSMIKVA